MVFETGVALILIAICSILTLLVIKLRDEDNGTDYLPIRILFFLTTMFFLVLSLGYAHSIASDNGASATTLLIIITAIVVMIPISIICLLYIIILLLVAATQVMRNKRNKSIFDEPVSKTSIFDLDLRKR